MSGDDDFDERWNAAKQGELVPPAGMFDDEPPVEAYDIPANVVPITNKSSPKSSALDANVTNMAESVDRALKAAYAREVRRNNGQKLLGAACGLTRIDKAIDGWQRKRVHVIGGRSGMGKSMVALNAGIGLAKQGEPVAYMSIEMPTTEQAMRALFAEGRVETWRWKEGKMREQDWNALYVASEALKPLPWLFDETSSMTVEQVRAKCEYMKRRFMEELNRELHTVIIDHVLLLKGTNERQPRREQVIHITRSIKGIANDLDLCIMELTQLNRSMEARSVKDKKPQISDLKESGSSEEDADVIMLLYRADYYEKDKSQWTNELEVNLPKIRGGEAAYAKLRFDGARQRIENLAGDDDPDDTPEAQKASREKVPMPTSEERPRAGVDNDDDDGDEVPDVQDVGPTDYLDSLLPRE